MYRTCYPIHGNVTLVLIKGLDSTRVNEKDKSSLFCNVQISDFLFIETNGIEMSHPGPTFSYSQQIIFDIVNRGNDAIKGCR